MGCAFSSALKYDGVNNKVYHTEIADFINIENFNIFSKPLCPISFSQFFVVIIWAIKILSIYHYVTVTFTVWTQQNLICIS